jgi:putative hemolysin
LGYLGQLEVKLATAQAEIRAAQRLRQLVFSEDRQVGSAAVAELDEDEFDPLCDHLLVVDHSGRDQMSGAQSPVVATCRLLGMDMLGPNDRFYSASEFTISRLIEAQPGLRFLEFGRSCVRRTHRDKRTVELLWHGSWAYVRSRSYDVMFGCASFPGTQLDEHAEALAFLSTAAGVTSKWPVRAVNGKGIPMNNRDPDSIDPKRALRKLPPLIKGYLRLGAMFAPEAVLDPVFGTTDVLVVLPVANLNPRYISHYGENADRLAALPPTRP